MLTENVKIQRSEKTRRLQTNLQLLRRIAGWTAEELGDRIGVTKQTISNLENSKSPLSYTQYIAIRTVMDGRASMDDCGLMLSRAMVLLLDSCIFDQTQFQEVRDLLEKVAESAVRGVTGDDLDTAFMQLLTSPVSGVSSELLLPITTALAELPELQQTASYWLWQRSSPDNDPDRQPVSD